MNQNGPPHIPDHELLRRIGRGSYGDVWLARSVVGSYRAVKIVRRDAFDNDRPYDREFSGLQKFEPLSRTHPGLVQILHVGRDAENGYFYCVMEVADDLTAGQTIDPETYRPRTMASDIAAQGRLPLRPCLELGISLADALAHLHAHGLVHRDIKPSNIIYVAGTPKFADIGLVTNIGSKATFVGTEGYLAPEGPGSPAADLYSLGRVLYEISMGKGQDDFPELPSRLRESGEAAGLMQLNDVILQACDPQASRRFSSATEMKTALERVRAQVADGGRGDGTGAGLRGRRVVVLGPGGTPELAALTRSVAEGLRKVGARVFVDESPEPSLVWARTLEQEIGQAEVVVGLLAEPSIRNEMLVYGMELARKAATAGGPGVSVVAALLNLDQEIPRNIRASFDGTRQVVWRGSGPLVEGAEFVVKSVSAPWDPELQL
jgi:hypothetical protein